MNAIDVFRLALDGNETDHFYRMERPCVAIVNEEMFRQLTVAATDCCLIKATKSSRERFKRRNGRAQLEILGVAVYSSGVESPDAHEITFGYAKPQL